MSVNIDGFILHLIQAPSEIFPVRYKSQLAAVLTDSIEAKKKLLTSILEQSKDTIHPIAVQYIQKVIDYEFGDT